MFWGNGNKIELNMENEKILENLSAEYDLRFSGKEADRVRVWKVLVERFFQSLIGQDKVVLDLGCGYGEFINQIDASQKFGMDLNPNAPKLLNDDVEFLEQDCSHEWSILENSLDVVFTSNFFEHLPNKVSLSKTLEQAYRCLKPGGKIICMGPNIKFIPGAYWDFWDHFLELTELSISEGLTLHGFKVTKCIPKFLPYTMSDKKPADDWLIKLYLKLPMIWPLKGKQFLVVAEREA